MRKAFTLVASSLLLASCGGNQVTADSPYRIRIYDFGYEASVDDKGIVTFKIPEVLIELYSSAGAPDVQEIKFTGTLLDGDGQPAAASNSEITPLGGTLFAGGKGGYFCPTTPSTTCTAISSDVAFVNTGPQQWPQNAYTRAMVPGEWASAQWSARPLGGTAPWSVDMVFTAYQTNGKVVSWKQNFQFTRPAQ